MPVRKIPRSYTSVTGRHSVGPGGRAIGFESTLERDFITLMKFDPDFKDIDEQPITLFYRDAKTGRERSYTPDFLVFRKGQQAELVEVKPSSILAMKQAELSQKFEVAEGHARNMGWKFTVWTEKEIRIPRLENARFLLPYRDREVDPGLSARIIRYLENEGVASAERVLLECWKDFDEQARGLSALWYLIAIGRIRADLDIEIDKTSPLRIGECVHG